MWVNLKNVLNIVCSSIFLDVTTEIATWFYTFLLTYDTILKSLQLSVSIKWSWDALLPKIPHWSHPILNYNPDNIEGLFKIEEPRFAFDKEVTVGKEKVGENCNHLNNVDLE